MLKEIASPVGGPTSAGTSKEDNEQRCILLPNRDTMEKEGGLSGG